MGKPEKSALSRKQIVQLFDEGKRLHEAGDFVGALKKYRIVAHWQPNDPGVWLAIGRARIQTGDRNEGIRCLEKCVQLDDYYVFGWSDLGRAYEEAGQGRLAEKAYLRCLAVAPGYFTARLNLARLYESRGDAVLAMQVFEEWVRVDQDNPMAAHMLAAYGGGPAPARASPDFVETLFDEFADSFDENLAKLGYRAPAIVANVLGEVLQGVACGRILDAGCGTGLCGPLLRPLTKFLVGVDISSRMLLHAQQKKCYHLLHLSDLLTFKPSQAEGYLFDAIVSSDTLNYFGELPPILTHFASLAADNCWLVFTLESAGEDVQGTSLRPHGRYVHRLEYAQEALVDAGWRTHTNASIVLRDEGGEKVHGFLIVAQKGVA